MLQDIAGAAGTGVVEPDFSGNKQCSYRWLRTICLHLISDPHWITEKTPDFGRLPLAPGGCLQMGLWKWETAWDRSNGSMFTRKIDAQLYFQSTIGVENKPFWWVFPESFRPFQTHFAKLHGIFHVSCVLQLATSEQQKRHTNWIWAVAVGHVIWFILWSFDSICDDPFAGDLPRNDDFPYVSFFRWYQGIDTFVKSRTPTWMW